MVADPVPTLVADAARAEMLVLGSRGYGTLAGYLVGSVSLHVLRQATRPVVMVRGTEQEGGPEPLRQQVLTDAPKPWREKYPEVDVVEHVQAGAASEVLLSHSERADVLVVGRRTHDTGVRRPGPVTHAVLHHARCAVAVVPHA